MNRNHRTLFSIAPPWAFFALLVIGSSIGTLPANAQEKKEGRSAAAAKKAAAEKASAKTEEDNKWSVDAPPGAEFFETTIDTDEGTWISLDLSPDGKTIVFDLLGDLYLLPATGGEATALTEGLAWDMQPRFSPDGSTVAFISDREGGDNIFTVKVGGGDPTQVSKETYRLVNNPVWSPDGEFIAARKHFSSTRSLGSGEIWLYHRSGGEGLQLNEKPNEQKDLGEPAFSPDGRYVYISRDSTPGGTFEYSKDSNGQIYTIERIDRETGEVERVISGAGGAVRPTPSPDGSSLAFVRREGFQSKLFVHDLLSGENQVLYDKLDRDMQEIWAIHGVYPGMAWTPDSTGILFWAAGKIHKVDLATKTVTNIPFHVATKRRMTKPLRFNYDPAPATTKTKMLRFSQVSPDGSSAVFQALGYLWLKQLPDGAPRRITNQEDHFELYPTFSYGGQRIVYVTWNDDELGSVRSIATDGSDPRILTNEPGHYVEPALSPDGRALVFRKVRGGFITSSLWSKEPGIYRQWLTPTGVPNGKPKRLHQSGLLPHFGASNDRVYFTVVSEWNKRALNSVLLDETEPRQHATSEVATEFRVSPNGQWLAFSERFKAFVTPFVAASKPVQVGPKTSSLPVKQVSKDAGYGLHWSGDSSKLYWSLGSTVFNRSLIDAFGFLEGSPETLPEAPEVGIDLGFEFKSDVPSGTVAFVGGKILTMAGDGRSTIITDGTVVVEGNRIVSVGSAQAARDATLVPPGAFVVDLAGRTLMPGIIDVHWHGALGTNEIVPQQNYQNLASLAFGVTTAHNPSTDTSTFFAASEMARKGEIVAPRLFSTGTILYGASGEFKAIIESLDDARAHLRQLKAAGAFSVKSYNQPRRDQRQKIVAAARELEMLVVNEGGALFQHNMTMVADGHTGIEHSLPVAAIYDDVRQFWGATDVGNTPTLVVAFGGIEGERYWYQHTNVWENERLLSFVPKDRVAARARRRIMAPEEDYNHFNAAKVVKDLWDSGVSIQLGAHGQREGLGAHWEMWMLEQGGMTPMEALQVATVQGARYLGMSEHLGSIEPGKLADLIVIDGDPASNLRDSENVDLVMINGRLYDAATMNEVGNRPRQRRPLWWQK